MFQKIKQLSQDIFMTRDELSSNKNIGHYLFGIILLFACGFKLYHDIQNTVDIQYADEAAYMRFGLNLFDKLNRDWGPMYTIWYKCLSFITTDTIQLYYINYVTTSVLIGILLYVFLLRISVHHVFALLISFSVLVSDLNVSVWPRISHFCIVLCLVELIITTFIKNNIYKFLVFTLLCLINSYARPEFYLSFIALTFCTIICIVYNKKTIVKKDFIIIFCVIILIGILHYIFRFPSNDFFGYNRGVAAFYQHYAWNYKLKTHGTFDAWLIWEDLAKSTFGDCNSMLCVIKTQPLIFINNTLFNVRTYLLQLLKVVSYVFPLAVFHGKKMQLLISATVILSSFILLIKKDSRKYFIRKLGSYKFYLLILFLFAAPTFISCIVVFPRDHYLYLQMLFMILILVSLFGYIFQSIDIKPFVFIGFGIFLFFATPNIGKYNFLKVNTNTDNLCNKELIKHLEKSYANQPHTIFTNLPFVTGMLPTNFKEVNTIFDKKKNKPFQHYADSANIDMIIVLPSIFRDPHIKSDSTWNNFIANYEKYGFKKDVFNDCETYLLVKEQ